VTEELKRFNLEEIRKAIGILFADVKFGAGECIEVRVPDKKKRITAAGWFDDKEALAKSVARLARDGFSDPDNPRRFVHENAYWTCNPASDALLARQKKNTIAIAPDTTSDNNITRRLWLPIDIDPLRPSGVSATNAEKKLAREVVETLGNKLIDELGFPSDCIVGGSSGNGYHILIRIELPNDNDARDLIKKCLAAMQGMVGTGKVEVDPKVYNAARIIKCYGTLACKGMNTADRPWRWSKLSVVPKKVVVCPTELLEKLAALAPEKNPKRALGEKRQGPWDEENTQAYLDWTNWEHGDMLPGGKPEEIAKWLGTCIVNPDHRDAAVILHTDGWNSYTCFHASCRVTWKQFTEHWEEENGERYDYPKRKLELSDSFEIEDACDGISEPIKPVDWSKVKVNVNSLLTPDLKEKLGAHLPKDETEPKSGATTVVDTEEDDAPAHSLPLNVVVNQKVRLQKWNLTDSGNAERFVARYGHAFRFASQRGWFYWDGKRWAPDSIGRVMRCATMVARKIEQELPYHLDGVVDAEKQTAIEGAVRAWAKKSESRTALGAMEYLARFAKTIDIKLSDFDRNPWAFNVANGTIDLTTGGCQPQVQADLITKLSPVEFDPKATCPLWLEFLADITAQNEELIGYLQRAVGYTLTGSTTEHCLFLLHGTGRNGKSTFIETIRYLLGDYGVAAHMSTFLVKKGDSIPNDLAALQSARMVAAVETEESKRLDEPKIKQITGGDTITARFMFKEFFEFKPQFKIWLATNALPVVRGTDEGIWRRMKRIPFNVYIPDGKKDEKLGEKLKSEASGILNWALEGLDDYRRNSLDEPQCVTDATEEYRGSMDWLERFIAEECEIVSDKDVSSRRLYERFCQWADRTGEYQCKEIKFAEAMVSHGYKKGRSRTAITGKQVNAYLGMKLKDHLANVGVDAADMDMDLNSRT
jgi:P4 family phage/plasmid primase-like protien